MKIEIDRKFCIGLFIVGVVGHYDHHEIAADKGIRYIAEMLRKKHFEMKNGTVEMRTWSNPLYVEKQIKRNPKKAKEFLEKNIKAVKRKLELENKWKIHSKIADNAWRIASHRFSENSSITTNQLIFSLLRKNEDVIKYYKYNPKKIEKILKPHPHKENYIMQSSRVATALLDELNSEIAYYYADSEYYLTERSEKIKNEYKVFDEKKNSADTKML